MGRLFHDEEEFTGMDYTSTGLPEGDYEDCRFSGCNISGSDLSGSNFGSCDFEDCDLSMTVFSGNTLRDARFIRCKMVGLNFENLNAILFSVEFENCQMDLCSFHGRSLTNTSFKDCRLYEVDFTEADLTGSLFHLCDLTGAIFINSILDKVDFRTSSQYVFDPEMNSIKKARFSSMGALGLLSKFDIIID